VPAVFFREFPDSHRGVAAIDAGSCRRGLPKSRGAPVWGTLKACKTSDFHEISAPLLTAGNGSLNCAAFERDARRKTSTTAFKTPSHPVSLGVDGKRKSVIIPLLSAPRVQALFKN
jgi:hypothetical protein